jgi:hypothetical protein
MNKVYAARTTVLVVGFVSVLLVAPVCPGLDEGKLTPFEKREKANEEHVKANDPKLFQLYSETRDSEIRSRPADFTTPLITVIQRADELRRRPRPPEDAAYIVKALVTAYGAEPRDWATVGAALTCAQHGVNDPRVAAIAEEIVRSVRSIPDEKLSVVPEAMRVLALTHQPKYINLLTASLSREALGIDFPGPAVWNERRRLTPSLIHTLLDCLSVEEAKAAFRGLAGRFPMPQQRPTQISFEYEVAMAIDGYLNGYLPRVERGEGPEAL